MRQPSAAWSNYILLRDQALVSIADGIDVFSIKKEFQLMIKSKRRFERINTIRGLVEVKNTVRKG